MKKIISMLVLCLTVTLTGCSGGGETQSEPKEPVQEETVEEETVQEDEGVQSDASQGQKENEAKNEEATSSEKSAVEEGTVYFVNAEGNVEKKTVSATDMNGEFLWSQLQESGVISNEAQLLAMNTDGQGQMELDVDEKFGEQLRSMGTSGENDLIKCVVNSFLDTFSCERVKITENGQMLVSGHREYDGYMERKE